MCIGYDNRFSFILFISSSISSSKTANILSSDNYREYFNRQSRENESATMLSTPLIYLIVKWYS